MPSPGAVHVPTPDTIPVSLHALLSRARNVSGAPPESVLTCGVACLNPAHIIRLRANVLDPIFLSIHPSPPEGLPLVTLAHVWPLHAVDDGYAALDSSTLKSLSLDNATLASCPTSSSLSKQGNKSNTQNGTTPPSRRARRKRKGSLNPSSPSVTPSRHNETEQDAQASSKPKHETVLSLSLLQADNIPTARTVRVKSAVDSPISRVLTSSESFEDSLHSRLHGRLVLPNIYINAPLLGTQFQFIITSVDGDDRTAGCLNQSLLPLKPTRVGDFTLVILDDDHRATALSTPQDDSKLPLIDRLGGIEGQLAVLKPFLRDALQMNKNTKTELRENEDDMQSDANDFRAVAKGALLYGPMGSGKTALTVAVAQWANAHTETISCGSLLTSSDAANSATKLLQTAFVRIKRRAPAVLILDDIDAIAPKRDSPNTDATRVRVLAALLKLFDDLDRRSPCAVLGTTTQRDSLDPAIRRSGRLDIELEVGIPTPSQRTSMLLALARHSGVMLSEQDAHTAAAGGHGHVAADLSSAWRKAIASSHANVTAHDIIQAVRAVRPSALREVWVEVPTTRWSDVGGKEDAKQRLREAVEWPMTRGRLLKRLGIRPPTGVLLFGPPGCSKTLLARAVATECGANFISIKGAELLSKYVGDSEKAVRKTFERARAAVPCVVFFDEVDAIASERTATTGSGVHARVVAQLLHEMDGTDRHVEQSQRVIVIAATNRPDCLDKAFLRAGRIDIQVYVGLPDSAERLDILRVHTKKTPLADDVDLLDLADDHCTESFSGAEIAALVREAGLCAMERDVANVDCICRSDFDAALRKVKPRTSQETIRYFDSYMREMERKRPR